MTNSSPESRIHASHPETRGEQADIGLSNMLIGGLSAGIAYKLIAQGLETGSKAMVATGAFVGVASSAIEAVGIIDVVEAIRRPAEPQADAS